jgi:NAD(P)-dependent dehydrogenase (short-subunit alcohol dehydrogenase family)
MRVRDHFLDKSLLGYTSLGYRWRSHSSIDADLTGRTAVVTGATSGLGKQTATELACLGATVQLVGRNRDKSQQVAAGITEETGSAAVGVQVADLSLMSDVRALAERIEAPIHILVNNAGVLLPTRTETAEGIETAFATNLLGHFLLTNLLVPKLAASARIINIASGGMYAQRISVSDLQNACGTYDGAKAYARTKRGQVILTELWAGALCPRGVVVHAMHP